MKRNLITLATLALLLTGAAPVFAQKLAVNAGPKTVTINDKVGKNQFIWISTAPLECIKGSSEGVSGTLSLDPQDLSKIRGSITTQTNTMKTGNDTRDHHLQSAEWIDAGKFPLIEFEILSISNVKTSGNTATGYAIGAFNMHGVSKKITVPFSLSYIPESDKTRQRAPGDLVMFSADFNISLKDFNINGTEGVVGSKVGETIEIKAQLFGNALPKTTAAE
jgi:polyisoprenoid-binding protein YceI